MRRALSVIVLVIAVSTAGALPAGAKGPTRSGGHARPGRPHTYGIGITTFMAEDPARPGRTLTFDVWYPTAPGTTTGTPASLDLFVTELALPGVRRDAEPADTSHRPRFPLVAFSHGSGGVRFQSWFLLQALAQRGYVVIAPDHAGNTALDPLFGTVDPFPVVARNRPRDISFAIDQALARSADPADLLAGTVDRHRIAVAGHSFGGFTALAVAGGYQDYEPDERVDATIPIAAASGILTDDELAAVDIPTLLLAGTDDITVPLESAAIRPWAEISGTPSWRVDVQRAGHNSFTNVCDLRDALVDSGLPPDLLEFLISAAEEGCAPTLIPIDQAHRLTIHYVTSFLRATLHHDLFAHLLLSPWLADVFDLPVDVFVRRHSWWWHAAAA